MTDVTIKQVDPSDDEILEEWVRSIEDEVLGAGCSRSEDEDWPWRVEVCVMEFIRPEPLQTELADAISAALRRVPGVRDAQHEDREAWVVAGSATGPDLLQAVAEVLDQFASKARLAIKGSAGAAEPASKQRPWWRFW